LSLEEQAEAVATGYTEQLEKWFRWSLSYPIKEKYEHNLPKYHLIFGSRSHHAIFLMNNAMVKARREFVGTISKGYLMNMAPEKEDIDENEIRELVVSTLDEIGKTRWELLRAHSIIRKPCFYKNSEINRAIKKAIQEGYISSNRCGKKIEEDALMWI